MTAPVKNADTMIKIFTIISLTVPILTLYLYQDSLYPRYRYDDIYKNTFEVTWKGRTYYLFFLWLFFMELILGWEEIKPVKHKSRFMEYGIVNIARALPTIYVLIANFGGLNKGIIDLTWKYGVPLPDWMALSIEYLVLTVLFALIIVLTFGVSGLRNSSMSIVFLGIIGAIFTIDNLYPHGTFLPFQFLVPATAMLAANVLTLLGYQTMFLSPTIEGMPHLMASNSNGSFDASIGWPCSGIDSLLIYTVTILLFLRKSTIPLKQRIAYFIIGAAITYAINILRIVTIFVIGVNGGDWRTFHDFYGSLLSITWIISYPLIIIGSRTAWGKVRQRRIKQKNADISTHAKVRD